MRVLVVTPAPAGSSKGNRISAERWAGHLRSLSHAVEIAESYGGQPCDLLVALHARRSAESVQTFRTKHPALPIVVILTGTDLYADLPDDPDAIRSVELATLLVVLNPLGASRLAAHLRSRVRVVVQSVSVPPPEALEAPPPNGFQVCVVGHLRPVKDPFLAAKAVSELPPASAIRVVHLGKALDRASQTQAQALQLSEPRYTWLGEVSQTEVLRTLKHSKAHVLSSKMEGGANSLCEAIALGVPTLASRIDGSVGLLGEDYPGFFPVGDAAALRTLLERIEADATFREQLRQHCIGLQPMVAPEAERAAIDSLINELERLELVVVGGRDPAADLAEDVRAGLTASPKTLHCRYFYDARGSQLFEDICRLPEYYLTRAEGEILAARSDEIANTMGPKLLVFELGSGSGEKTQILLSALTAANKELTYAPVDISRSMLEESAFSLMHRFDKLSIVAVAAEYLDGLRWLEEQTGQQKLVVWLGSNLGNFDRPGGAAFLSEIRKRISTGDRLLVGVDLRKGKAVLEAAYDDAQGVTAEFNKNLLHRINRELGGDFNVDGFDHRAFYDDEDGRVVMRLISRRACRVSIKSLDLSIDFAAGEAIHTEDSYKYSPAELGILASASGFTVDRHWSDSGGRFYLGLLAPDENTNRGTS